MLYYNMRKTKLASGFGEIRGICAEIVKKRGKQECSCFSEAVFLYFPAFEIFCRSLSDVFFERTGKIAVIRKTDGRRNFRKGDIWIGQNGCRTLNPVSAQIF